jgi:hypothetical protein
MNRRKLFKSLRIAWSVVWGVVAVLLCVLWVRSGVVELHVTKDQFVQVFSDKTSARFSYFDYTAKGFISLELPYWVWLLVATILAAAPWLRFRYSLRTLLIATTLVGVVLGLAGLAAR